MKGLRPIEYVLLVLSALVVVYSQYHALTGTYVINDDVCQHIWWMRQFQDPALFRHDLLAVYAQSLQHPGILALYSWTSFFIDPVLLTKALPFFFLPLACFFLFRWVKLLAGDDFTAFFVTVSFMVTPLYIQHMTGGQAHAFGFTFLIAFLYFLAAARFVAAGSVLAGSALFFPVVFAIGVVIWLFSFPARRQWIVLAAVLVFGLAALGVKFCATVDPRIGQVYLKPAIAHMPEFTAEGRWEVFPVKPVYAAMTHAAEAGVFVFKAGWKTPLSEAMKDILFRRHIFLALLCLCASAWWFLRRTMPLLRWIMLAVTASFLLYEAAAALLLRLYAPDRYVMYSVSLAALLFLVVPAAHMFSRIDAPVLRRALKALALVLVLMQMPLTRDAGLTDYSAQQGLYVFCRTLPKDAVIAAPPDLADGIPVFSRRTVLFDQELAVPLFDGYWPVVKARMKDFFKAYYAQDGAAVRAFTAKYGVTHLVIDRSRFFKSALAGRVTFEPMNTDIKKDIQGKTDFVLKNVADGQCLFLRGNICVADVNALTFLAQDTRGTQALK
ncbi:MAG: hypothetical protein HQL19_06035 [Candidatus Omnitrophica bacterium]|nr:hypothetical protein [Candidatus Omnitrophota bacterium]